MERQLWPCTEWIFQDVPSDITIDVGKASFMLHKFPLVSRCGRIRKLIEEQIDTPISRLELFNLPGGSKSFELAVKFCYGVLFDITSSNVAQLCCVADYLEMTEELASENLASRAEAYLDSFVCKSIKMCIEVLSKCQDLLPLADELNIVGRCTDSIASKACTEQIASSFQRLEYSSSGRLQTSKQSKSCQDWWIEGLSVLRIDMYRGVIAAMKCRGVHPESIGKSLVHYAEKLLNEKPTLQSASYHSGSDLTSNLTNSNDKILVEYIVSLLPVEKQSAPVSFLFGLLRAAVILDCPTSCRLNLERRIGAQLEMATLDDLLIPSFRHNGETLFEVDMVHRILVSFAQNDISDSEGSEYFSDGLQPPSQSALIRVARLVDGYLAEIAPDANLRLAKFMVIADTLPRYARIKDDALYRAIDIYLKAHPGLSETEKRRLCKLIDFRKLSEETSSHAAQNERLPLQAIVHVLYIEQLRLRDVLGCSNFDDSHKMDHQSRRISSGAPSVTMSPRDNYASLRRENRELKLELARMRMRLNDLEKGHASMRRNLEKSGSQSQKLINCLKKKIKTLNFFSPSELRRSSPWKEDSNITAGNSN